MFLRCICGAPPKHPVVQSFREGFLWSIEFALNFLNNSPHCILLYVEPGIGWATPQESRALWRMMERLANHIHMNIGWRFFGGSRAEVDVPLQPEILPSLLAVIFLTARLKVWSSHINEADPYTNEHATNEAEEGGSPTSRNRRQRKAAGSYWQKEGLSSHACKGPAHIQILPVLPPWAMLSGKVLASLSENSICWVTLDNYTRLTSCFTDKESDRSVNSKPIRI